MREIKFQDSGFGCLVSGAGFFSSFSNAHPLLHPLSLFQGWGGLTEIGPFLMLW